MRLSAKLTTLLLTGLVLPLSAAAQNWLVTFNGTNNPAEPYFWPSICHHVGTDNPTPGPLQAVLTRSQIEAIKTTNAAALEACRASVEAIRSNAVWQATAPARAAKDKVAALVATNAANAAARDTLLAQVSSAGNVAGLKVVFTNLVKQVDANTQLLKELGDALQKLYEQQQGQ